MQHGVRFLIRLSGVFFLIYLLSDSQRQLEQLFDETQLLAAFIQEAQQLTQVDMIRVLPQQRPRLYETPASGAVSHCQREATVDLKTKIKCCITSQLLLSVFACTCCEGAQTDTAWPGRWRKSGASLRGSTAVPQCADPGT